MSESREGQGRRALVVGLAVAAVIAAAFATGYISAPMSDPTTGAWRDRAIVWTWLKSCLTLAGSVFDGRFFVPAFWFLLFAALLLPPTGWSTRSRVAAALSFLLGVLAQLAFAKIFGQSFLRASIELSARRLPASLFASAGSPFLPLS